MAAEPEAQQPLDCGLRMSYYAGLKCVPTEASGSQSAYNIQKSDSPTGAFQAVRQASGWGSTTAKGCPPPPWMWTGPRRGCREARRSPERLSPDASLVNKSQSGTPKG